MRPAGGTHVRGLEMHETTLSPFDAAAILIEDLMHLRFSCRACGAAEEAHQTDGLSDSVVLAGQFGCF